MNKTFGFSAAVCVALFLAACGGNSGGGGGGGDNAVPSVSAPTVNVVAEGAWSGTNSLGNAFDMLLLEDGELYQVFGTLTAGVFSPQGLDRGHYAVSSSTLASAITQYNSNGSQATGTLTATVVAGSTIKGTAGSNVNNSFVTFSATPSGANHSGYDYNTAAALSDIAGPWSGAVVLGQTNSFSISIDATTGAIAGSILACSFSGSIAPRSSHKNVFNVNVTMGQAPCANAGQAYNGVAMSYLTSTNQRQLLAALQSPDKTLGTVLYALR